MDFRLPRCLGQTWTVDLPSNSILIYTFLLFQTSHTLFLTYLYCTLVPLHSTGQCNHPRSLQPILCASGAGSYVCGGMRLLASSEDEHWNPNGSQCLLLGICPAHTGSCRGCISPRAILVYSQVPTRTRTHTHTHTHTNSSVNSLQNFQEYPDGRAKGVLEGGRGGGGQTEFRSGVKVGRTFDCCPMQDTQSASYRYACVYVFIHIIHMYINR